MRCTRKIDVKIINQRVAEKFIERSNSFVAACAHAEAHRLHTTYMLGVCVVCLGSLFIVHSFIASQVLCILSSISTLVRRVSIAIDHRLILILIIISVAATPL